MIGGIRNDFWRRTALIAAVPFLAVAYVFHGACTGIYENCLWLRDDIRDAWREPAV